MTFSVDTAGPPRELHCIHLLASKLFQERDEL
jgi:hypothetical protein